MSKKNKKKFKANLAQMIGQIEKEEKQIHQHESIQSVKPIDIEKIDDSSKEDKFIKHDVLKIVYGLVACFIVLGITWYMNNHTDIINNLSQNIAHYLRIGQ